MKLLIITFLCFALYSCSSVAIDNDIVSNIIEDQLAMESYSHLKSLDILLIEDADNGYQALKAYEFAYTYGNYKDTTKILDEAQQKGLRERLIDKKVVPWSKSEIKNIEYKLITWDTIKKNIRTERFLNNPNKLVISIGRPLFIDADNALVSFHSGTTEMGFTTVDRFTVLVTKKGNKWVRMRYYYDGVYH